MDHNHDRALINAVAVTSAAAVVVLEEQLRQAAAMAAEIAAAGIDLDALVQEADEDLRAAGEDDDLLSRTQAALEALEADGPVSREESEALEAACEAIIAGYLARDRERGERLDRRRAAHHLVDTIRAKYAAGHSA
ncbi:hypothetical protein OG618_36940 (plasmid) [Kitasatospora sp. NBC_01246]|uniref:hypothetical protein n=1 Tax=Kitasatospora sp. NBC_01246 TaxID=2903570 RepID=UPI002E33B6A5|nr:hypothetical protein [Kitasatospora sp. NBC_01246]